jgi:hypothetical protein
MAYWLNSFRSLPSDIPGWRDWYWRVSVKKSKEWDNLGITHYINLLLASPTKNEMLLLASYYFWSDA